MSPPLESLAVERLDRRHDRTAFDCGQPTLNDWLKLRAGQFDRKNLARVFVAVRPGEVTVLGYYALSTHHVAYASLPTDLAKGLPRIDVPVILIGRLAVDRTMHGQGLGTFLLADALQRILRFSAEVGLRGVEVDAINPAACQFYSKFGFVRLLDDPLHLFLPLQAINRARLVSLE